MVLESVKQRFVSRAPKLSVSKSKRLPYAGHTATPRTVLFTDSIHSDVQVWQVSPPIEGRAYIVSMMVCPWLSSSPTTCSYWLMHGHPTSVEDGDYSNHLGSYGWNHRVVWKHGEGLESMGFEVLD